MHVVTVPSLLGRPLDVENGVFTVPLRCHDASTFITLRSLLSEQRAQIFYETSCQVCFEMREGEPSWMLTIDGPKTSLSIAYEMMLKLIKDCENWQVEAQKLPDKVPGQHRRLPKLVNSPLPLDLMLIRARTIFAPPPLALQTPPLQPKALLLQTDLPRRSRMC